MGKPANVRMVLGQHPHEAAFTRGLARIISHEIVHVLLPGRPHAAAGLFSQELTRRDLLGEEIALDQETRAALSERLCVPR